MQHRWVGAIASVFVGAATAVAALVIATAASTGFSATFVVPQLTGPVVDGAGIVNPTAAGSLDVALRRLRLEGGPQINVLTVPTLDGLPIESASIQVTDAWKLGGGKADDGVLLMVALEERRIRIEVGQGLEGTLTDLHSKQIIDDVMKPYFRAGRPSDGIVAGVQAIVARVAPDKVSLFGEKPNAVRSSKRRGGESSLPFPVIIIFVILFLIFGRRGRGGFVTGYALGTLSGRGGWGGGGRGSGSWSGGGGGFSGGGASGGW